MKKDDLIHLREYKEKMDGLKRAIADLEATVTDISVHLSDMPRSGQYRDVLAEFVAKKESVEIRLMQVTAEYMERFVTVEEKISVLPYAQQTVIRLYYEKALSWTKVSRESHYARSYCKTLQKKALERLEQE